MPYDQDARTRFAARIIGPVFIGAALAIIMRQGTLSLLFPAFFQDAPLVLITGVFTLTLGLVLFAAHHHWTSLAAIVISVLGIATAFRGLLLMAAPDVAAQLAAGVLATPILPPIAAAVTALLGLWLTFVGWFAKPSVGTNA